MCCTQYLFQRTAGPNHFQSDPNRPIRIGPGSEPNLDNRSLAAVLTTDGSGFDNDSRTYDFLDEAVQASTPIEAVLLHHVVPGATIYSKETLKADGVNVDTAWMAPAVSNCERRISHVEQGH
jgi:hypothetical protein